MKRPHSQPESRPHAPAMASVHDEADVLRHRSLSTTLRQLFRFGVIGLLQNGIGYGLYLVLTLAGLPPKPTMTFLYLAGATVSFLANRRFTFGHTGKLTHAGIRFMLAHLGGYLINLLLLWWLVDQNGYPHQWVQASAIFVVAAYLFVSFRFFVFPAKSNS